MKQVWVVHWKGILSGRCSIFLEQGAARTWSQLWEIDEGSRCPIKLGKCKIQRMKHQKLHKNYLSQMILQKKWSFCFSHSLSFEAEEPLNTVSNKGQHTSPIVALLDGRLWCRWLGRWPHHDLRTIGAASVEWRYPLGSAGWFLRAYTYMYIYKYKCMYIYIQI